MRVLAVLLSTWPLLAETTPFTNIAGCVYNLGVVKCFNALTTWRAERELATHNLKTKLVEDLNFPWKEYANYTSEELHSQLCDETERLLRRKPLSLAVPGYRFEVSSNGTLNFNVYKEVTPDTARGMKKAKKKFLSLLPLLAIPGLLMSAVIPFALPAMKMLTIGAVLLNNMAFTAAVFTLLRNNAFNDKYHHKVIYVNEGYENEKHIPHYDVEESYGDTGYVDEHTAPDNAEVSDWQSYPELGNQAIVPNRGYIQAYGGEIVSKRRISMRKS